MGREDGHLCVGGGKGCVQQRLRALHLRSGLERRLEGLGLCDLGGAHRASSGLADIGCKDERRQAYCRYYGHDRSLSIFERALHLTVIIGRLAENFRDLAPE